MSWRVAYEYETQLFKLEWLSVRCSRIVRVEVPASNVGDARVKQCVLFYYQLRVSWIEDETRAILLSIRVRSGKLLVR